MHDKKWSEILEKINNAKITTSRWLIEFTKIGGHPTSQTYRNKEAINNELLKIYDALLKLGKNNTSKRISSDKLNELVENISKLSLEKLQEIYGELT